MATATARKQKATTKHGKLHKPDLTKYYVFARPRLRLDTQDFRLTLLRPDERIKTNRVLPVGGMVTTVEWRYETGNPVLLGTVTFRPPDFGKKISIHDGHTLRCEVTWGGKRIEVWRMRLRNGQQSLDNTHTFELADDSVVLQESVDTWHFTKNKHKPHGWYCHEIAAAVARRYRIPLGKVAEGKHRITDIHGEMSPMQVLQRAYAIERRNSGRRYVMAWRNGKLNITPLRRNPLLYVLEKLIIDATITREPRDALFATALSIRGMLKGKKGSRKSKKVHTTYVDEKAVKREGFVHRNFSAGDVKDMNELRQKAKRYVNKHGNRKQTLEGLQHPGIALVRRGDAIQVRIPRYGITGRKSICFVSAGTWQLSGGTFTMQLDVTFDDPYFVSAKERQAQSDKQKRAQKRKAKAQS